MENKAKESESVIIRDRKLEPIEDKKMAQFIKKLLTETSSYLMEISSPENKEAIQERLPHIDAVMINPKDKTGYMKVNGELDDFDISSFDALTTVGNLDIIDNRILADYYIYLRENNSTHIARHEIMHALSSTREAEYLDDNIYAIKVGLSRSFELALKEDLLDTVTIYTDGDFINEGMTDYLTYLSEEKEIDDYTYYTYIENILLAKFLVGANIESENNLIQAHVSDTIDDIEGFEKEFNSYMKNKGIKYEDYGQFGDEINYNEYTRLLKGAMTYRIKSAKTPDERNNEIAFYKQSITDIKENKKLRKELKQTFKQRELELMTTRLEKHLDRTIVNKEQDNEFSISTQDIGKTTIHSPTKLKNEVENIERKLTAREKAFINRGIVYNV